MEFINSGYSKAEACRVFKIGRSTIFEWLKKLRNLSVKKE
ncbi:IS630 transposase-related protein [Candidatus Mesenet endosymbiont of Phosphuga atrata]